MRSGALLALLAAGLVAGCASPMPPSDDPSPPPVEPATTVRTEELAFFVPAAAEAPAGFGVYDSEPFEVPAGVLHLRIEAEWSCVTMCPLDLQLRTPAGETAGPTSGNFNATIEVVNPVAGTWALEAYAGNDATVGTDGRARLSFQVLA